MSKKLLTIYICIRLDTIPALDGQTDRQTKYRIPRKLTRDSKFSKFVENFISLFKFNVYFTAKIIECPTRTPIAFAVLLT